MHEVTSTPHHPDGLPSWEDICATFNLFFTQEAMFAWATQLLFFV
jgi:hypothetical protein